jgi:hypothetical protein
MIKNNSTLVNKKFNKNLFNNYIGSNNKIYSYELNYNLGNIQDINHNNKHLDEENYKKENKFNINNNDVDIEDVNSDSESELELEDEEIYVVKNKISPELNNPIKILHLNIPYLDKNNEWIDGSKEFMQEYSKTNLEYLKLIYMDERVIGKNFDQTNKSEPNKIFRIISETCKSNLESGIYDKETKYFTSTTLLNQDKIYDGLTNIELLVSSNFNNKINNKITNVNIQIESIKIRTRAKNKNIPNSYRNIQWDLEFDLIPGGYKILGLDNFIHMSLIGLEEIFLDVVYKANFDIEFESIPKSLSKMDRFTIELKYTRCIYNRTIKTNLEKFLYENEESYQTDIIDYLEQISINLDHEEKMFGNIYSTNYNILQIMSGMGGLAFST